MKVYQAFDVDEETPVQFVGVYTTKWKPEWGEPTIMFREVSQETQDLFDALPRMLEMGAEAYAVLDAIYCDGPDGHEEWVARVRKDLDELLKPLLVEQDDQA